eukprot:7186230-Pyramimonas_sp.AAC.1
MSRLAPAPTIEIFVSIQALPISNRAIPKPKLRVDIPELSMYLALPELSSLAHCLRNVANRPQTTSNCPNHKATTAVIQVVVGTMVGTGGTVDSGGNGG